jgi:uncharacterized protein (DUF2267 family)
MAPHTLIGTLDHAPQVAAEWLDALCLDLGWAERPRAYLLLRTVLHAVRDYLGPDEAADLGAQLPILVRGIYYEGWNPSGTPVHPRGSSDFIDRVTAAFTARPLEDPERAISAVFRLLRDRVSEGEIEQVARAMRKSLRELWS